MILSFSLTRGNHRLVRDELVPRSQLEQSPHEPNLTRAFVGHRFVPFLETVAGKWSVFVLVQIEEIQSAVAVPGRASEQRPVGAFPYLMGVDARRLAGRVVFI